MIEYTVEVSDYGTKHWFLNDKLHREDGPAVKDSDGYTEWWLNDKRHREDGPAVEWADGTKEWYLNGQRLTKEEWEEKTQHTIVIDGKTIQLSNENYNNLKQTMERFNG